MGEVVQRRKFGNTFTTETLRRRIRTHIFLRSFVVKVIRMDRKQFLLSLAALPLAATAMKLTDLTRLTDPLKPSERMPVLFLGHGSPMNAIEENEFVQGFRNVGATISRPQAVLVVSAHWETRGTQVTAMAQPRTIHDFGGFPKALFEVQYPAPGSPELAEETQRLVKGTAVGLDHGWGLDHGAWSVVKHLYPQADVPVIQMSIDSGMQPEQHYALAQELGTLREKGVLIIGSGNMVHNLRMVAWDKINEPFAFDWALEAQAKMSQGILSGDHAPLINFHAQGRAFDLATNSSEHYLPLLYALALQRPDERATLFNDKPLAGSLTMTSVKIDKA
jgi:4,5-DOPA dioxygenase extradiol